MFAPNISTHQLADQVHHERQHHASLLHKISRDRSEGVLRVDRQALRRTTSRRLAATIAGAVLSLSIVAIAAAQGTDAPAPAHPIGGGVTLLR
jgi:hypothetical protein